MTYNFRFLAVVAVSLLAAACDKSPSNAAPPPAPSETPAPTATVAAAAALASAPAASSAPPEPRAPKADPVDPAALKVGLAKMLPRVTAKVEALPNAKLEPNDHFRFFMHPGDDKKTSIEFNTKGIVSLDLAPFIQDLQGAPDCANNPQAGIARLTWLVDGAKKGSALVDRNYTGVVNVGLAGSSHLKLEVDKGNELALCDWFSVGMLNVK